LHAKANDFGGIAYTSLYGNERKVWELLTSTLTDDVSSKVGETEKHAPRRR
jgi:hypothetical protein